MRVDLNSAMMSLSFSTHSTHNRDAKTTMTRRKPDDDDHGMSDDSSTSSSSSCMSFDNDESEAQDSMGSLSGAIPSMSQYYQDDSQSTTMDESTPSIVYMGREYSADNFRNSARVVSQSARRSSSRRGGAGQLDTSSEHNTSRWSSLLGSERTKQPKKTISQSEQWGSTRRRSSTSISPKRTTQRPVISVPHSSSTGSFMERPSIASRVSSLPSNMRNAEPSGTRGRYMPNFSNFMKPKAMVSQSEYFGSTRRAATTTNALGSHSGHGTLSRSAHDSRRSEAPSFARRNTTTSASDYMKQAVINKLSWNTASTEKTAEEKKAERWQSCLSRWGYTNHDVLSIVEDDRIFAKLKSDLNQCGAVTNNIILQKIHVFVHNTKTRKLQELQQQQQQYSRRRASHANNTRRTSRARRASGATTGASAGAGANRRYSSQR